MFTSIIPTIISTKFQINQLTITLFSGSEPPPHLPTPLYDHKSDPQDHTDWSTDYMPYETCCTTHSIDQIQASLKNYSECLYITDLVSVINFYVNTPRDHNHRPFEKQFTNQFSNMATCKLTVSVLGSSRC